MSKALQGFLKQHFDFKALKKAGFYPKEMKANDYEGQAKRICTFFGYKSVYEYAAHEIRCHISYAYDRMGLDSNPPMSINKKGELESEPQQPFITVIHPNDLHL